MFSPFIGQSVGEGRRSLLKMRKVCSANFSWVRYIFKIGLRWLVWKTPLCRIPHLVVGVGINRAEVLLGALDKRFTRFTELNS